ncbi:MAG: hypothetical protein PVJ68_17275 [Candidatus Thiodiazotropha sp.]
MIDSSWPGIRRGVGAQRSNPKTGNPSRWRARGGQRDETRIFNYALS